MAESKKELTLREKLMMIQVELKAPKNLYNKFGNYSYRNAEGIQEALKPLEKKYGVATVISDEIVEVAGRVYVKATATIFNCDNEQSIEVTAYAREASDKKGMDDAQLTGATSSYARKYALNALFLLDDTKDADSDEYHEQVSASKAEPKPKTEKAVEQKEEQKEEKKTEVKENRSPARQKLYDFIAKNKFTKADQKKIIDHCKLTRDSSDEEFELALKYAEDMKIEKERPADYGDVPFEV